MTRQEIDQMIERFRRPTNLHFVARAGAVGIDMCEHFYANHKNRELTPDRINRRVGTFCVIGGLCFTNGQGGFYSAYLMKGVV